MEKHFFFIYYQFIHVFCYCAFIIINPCVCQNIQLQQVMVDGMVVRVCGYGIRGHIMRRMLYRGEGVNILPQRQYNDTAGMLTGTSPHSGTSLSLIHI